MKHEGFNKESQFNKEEKHRCFSPISWESKGTPPMPPPQKKGLLTMKIDAIPRFPGGCLIQQNTQIGNLSVEYLSTKV